MGAAIWQCCIAALIRLLHGGIDLIEFIGDSPTLTDLNSANATRINDQLIEPDTATSFSDGDTLSFGKVTCTFRKG
jgi:pSer/pThr/pTyr-binding forkhead associated (FHA) protein